MSTAEQERAWWDAKALGDEEDLHAATAGDLRERAMVAEILNGLLNPLIPVLVPGARVLDLGCGLGRLTVLGAARYPAVRFAGLDISPALVRRAQKRPTPDYLVGDGRTLPGQDWDAVFSFTVFQHIDPQGFEGYISEIGRVLRPGGMTRFQYVEGERDEFLHNASRWADVQAWLADAGLSVVDVDNGLLHPSWTWVTATKGER